jgi:hypothetical protein
MYRSLEGFHSRYGRGGEEKGIPLMPLPGIELRSSSPQTDWGSFKVPNTADISWHLKILKWSKVKFSLCLIKHHTMKTYWGSGSIAPRILDLGTHLKIFHAKFLDTLITLHCFKCYETHRVSRVMILNRNADIPFTCLSRGFHLWWNYILAQCVSQAYDPLLHVII